MNGESASIQAGYEWGIHMDTSSHRRMKNPVSRRSSNMGAKPPLIYLHIPKTAGSTLNKIIDHEYGPSTVFSIYEPRAREAMAELTEMSEAQRSNIRVLRAHGFFGMHKFFRPPVIYFTMLRDPVDRIISHYYYVRRSSSHRFHDTVTSQNMSLKDYVCHGTSKELDNGQVRVIAGHEANERFDFGQCSKELLEMAKRNLENHFAIVGLTERFDETLILLRRSLGWRRVPFYIRENTTKNRLLKNDLTTEVLNAIKRYNELDIELYEYVKERFDESVNHQGTGFIRDLRTFNIMNGYYQRAHSKSRSITSKVRALARKYVAK